MRNNVFKANAHDCVSVQIIFIHFSGLNAFYERSSKIFNNRIQSLDVIHLG